MKFVFFGHDDFSTGVLEELKKEGFVPNLVVTGPDKPVGRKRVIVPSLVSLWAEENKIQTLKPDKFDTDFYEKLGQEWDFFVVASYGKILPKKILEIPQKGVLNIHPSLLPELRGASPIQEALLYKDETGVSIMKVDEKMDHGPILVQKEVPFEKWPMPIDIVKPTLAKIGGKLISEVIPKWINGNIQPQEQEHHKATFTKKVEKEDALMDLESSPEENYRKFCAYRNWPVVYFLDKHQGSQIKVKVTDADLEKGEFLIKKVIPEGRKEMSFEDYKRGQR